MAKSKKRKSKKARKSKSRKYKLTVAGHRKIRPTCRRCGKRHSKMSHRSHGHGSYARTRGKRRYAHKKGKR